MSTLDDMIAGMLSDVSKKKAARKKATKRKSLINKTTMGAIDIGPAPILNPWEDEALVLLLHDQTCKACGNESTSWNPYIFLERKREVRGKVESHLTRISRCKYEELYGQYPQRIQVQTVETCACPQCFGILHNGNMQQMQLPLGEVQ